MEPLRIGRPNCWNLAHGYFRDVKWQGSIELVRIERSKFWNLAHGYFRDLKWLVQLLSDVNGHILYADNQRAQWLYFQRFGLTHVNKWCRVSYSRVGSVVILLWIFFIRKLLQIVSFCYCFCFFSTKKVSYQFQVPNEYERNIFFICFYCFSYFYCCW